MTISTNATPLTEGVAAPVRQPQVQSMPRIEPLATERASLLQRFIFFLTKRRVGKVLDPMRVVAHHGPIFQGYVGYEFALTHAVRVDVKLKTLASLRAGSLVGCSF